MRYLTIIILAVICFSCGKEEKPSKPHNLIPKEKMSDIIYDVFLMNAAKGINKRVLENNGLFPQEYVYKKHNIDSLQFAESNNYYSYDIKTYEGIMAKVKQKIEFEKAKYDSISLEEERIKDSIKEAKDKEKIGDTLLKSMKLKALDSTNPVKTVD